LRETHQAVLPYGKAGERELELDDKPLNWNDWNGEDRIR